ncbi:hypothetical protein QYE76_028703 [Lolium multiflorum]|uniref:CCHC-type domain-containing protein n=1 Tax=Lolium multiflorum TaxID=4521 RepID=A0AAD8VHJ1_LOLMU|nr:hypothetical protein QYE76_028703 [Lolium multiflorum]
MWFLAEVWDVVTILVIGSNLDVQVVDMMRKMDSEDGEPPIITWRATKEVMNSRFVPTNYLRTIYDKLTLLRQGVKTVDEYYMEMEMLMQRGCVRESLEMTMQRFLNRLKEAESQMAEEAKVKGRATGAGGFTPRAPPSTAPTPSTRSTPYSTPPSKPVSNVSNTKKSEYAASTSGSSMSTARNRDMACHTCGGKGHFKRDCPNRKVMIINEDNEYETGDDVDPNAPEDDDYDTDGEDAYPSDARTIVVSQRALNVLPSASTQRCNLFQTKALVGPDKACKVIIDGGSCRNLASKELCTKLKLKYLPHLHPYYIQWLSDDGEMKEFSDVFPEEVPTGLPPLRGIEHQIDLIPGASLPNMTPYTTNPEETKEIQKQESHAGGLMGHFGREKMLLMLADHFYWLKMRRDVDRRGDDEDIPTTILPPSLQDEDNDAVKLKSNEVRIGTMTRARAKLLKQQGASFTRGGEEHQDKKLDVKLDMELDKKISHGRAREEREACARGGDVQAGARPGQPAAAPDHPVPGPVERPTRRIGRSQTGLQAGAIRALSIVSGAYISAQDASKVALDHV